MADIEGWLQSGDGGEAVSSRLCCGPEVARRDAKPSAAGNVPDFSQLFTIHSMDGIQACIDGLPEWRDTTLERTAAHSGHAATLIQAYREHGTKLFSHLHGHFSLALVDEPRCRVLLAVDRMGTRPMCYAHTAKGIAFGSSADILRRHPGVDVDLSYQALYNYIYFHVIPSPRTIYNGIAKLEPSQFLVFSDDRLRLEYYWTPPFTSPDVDLDRLKTELRATLEMAVRKKIHGRTGTFLSGGLDSSTVSGMLARVLDEPAHTFSIGFSEEGYDEIEFARIAVKHFGTQQHEYYVTTDDVVDAIPRIARAYDEPFGNSSAIPTLLCAQLARKEGIETLLAGDGGDELFAGNERYAKQRLFEAYSRIPAPLRRSLLEPLVLSAPISWAGPVRKVRSYIQQAKIPMPERMQSYNLLNRIAITDVFEPDFLKAISPSAPECHLSEVYSRAPSNDFLQKMLFLDWKITLADNDLRKVNRMCEVAGITVRYPMLDDSLVALSARIPPSVNLRGQSLRYLFKEALKDFLPTEIIHKKKHGFGLPFGQWLRKSPNLQGLIYASLRTLQSRRIIRRDFVDKLLDAHRSDHAAYYGSTVWVLALMEQWFETHGIAP